MKSSANNAAVQPTRIAAVAALTTAILAAGSASAADGAAASPARRTRYLLLDSRIVENTDNAKLTVGTVKKHPANPLFGEDKPWEQRFDNLYPSVVYDKDEKLYKCWYNLFIRDACAKGMTIEQRHKTPYRVPRREDGICYAVSRDGLKWEKPELGLVEYEGGKANNLVLRGAHGAGVFFDPRDLDPGRRYKMFHARDQLRFSADGLRWSGPVKCEGVDSNGDTHNNMFWAPGLERYVAVVRLRGDSERRRSGQRIVGRSESADLKSWSRSVEVLRNDERDQAYSMPVFRYADVYFGLLAVFRTKEDCVHTELAWSPDTKTWHRIEPGRPLIGNAPNEGDYDWGCVYAGEAPVVLDDEIRIYYGGSNGKHTGWRDGFLCLATLRPDGWAGYEPVEADKPATLQLRPLTSRGKTLRVTADAQGGGITVRLRENDPSRPADNGKVVARSRPVSGNITGAKVEWEEGFDFAALTGKPVRLEFECTKAKIYSFTLGD